MADSLGGVVGDDDVGEALDALLLDGVLQADLGGLRLAVHVGVVALDNSDRDAESLKQEREVLRNATR